MMPLQKRDKSVHLKGLSASFLEMLFATKKKKNVLCQHKSAKLFHTNNHCIF